MKPNLRQKNKTKKAISKLWIAIAILVMLVASLFLFSEKVHKIGIVDDVKNILTGQTTKAVEENPNENKASHGSEVPQTDNEGTANPDDGISTAAEETTTEREPRTAPREEYTKWNYALDDTNNIITLKNYTSNVPEVVVYGSYEVNGKIYKTDLSKLTFNSNTVVTSIVFNDDIDTSNVTDMGGMFEACSALINLDLGKNFDTSNATEMSYMLATCRLLTSLELGNKFDTSNVTHMDMMFFGCSSLTNLNLGDKFNTSNVTRMYYMFRECSSLTRLDLGDKFNTSNVEDMDGMFEECNQNLSVTYSAVQEGAKFAVLPVPSGYECWYDQYNNKRYEGEDVTYNSIILTLIPKENPELPDDPDSIDGLSISKKVDKTTVIGGENLVYTITVTNATTVDKTVEISDVLPYGTNYISADLDGTPALYDEDSWTVIENATVKAGSQSILTILVETDTNIRASIKNIAELRSEDGSEIESNWVETLISKPIKIKEFTKELVKDKKSIPDGIDVSGIAFPNSEGYVIFPDNSSQVTLLYKIKVLGTSGTAYNVTDENTEHVSGALMEGTISESGEVTIYVKKTFDASDIDENGYLVNTAIITPGVNGYKDTSSTENTPAIIETEIPEPEIPEDGRLYTITVQNEMSGHIYNSYQVFGGNYAEGKDDSGNKIPVLSNITWGKEFQEIANISESFKTYGDKLLECLKEKATKNAENKTIYDTCNTAEDVANVLIGKAKDGEEAREFVEIVGEFIKENNIAITKGTNTQVTETVVNAEGEETEVTTKK